MALFTLQPPVQTPRIKSCKMPGTKWGFQVRRGWREVKLLLSCFALSDLTENMTSSLKTLQNLPPLSPPLRTPSQAAHQQREAVSCNRSHCSSWPAQLQLTTVKLPVNLADRYFCTESAFSCLLTTINSSYSQNIWELQENMGKNLSTALDSVDVCSPIKNGYIFFHH